MKKVSQAIVKSYSIAIIRTLKNAIENDFDVAQRVIIQLNQILNALFKAGLLKDPNYNQISEAVLKTTLNPEVKNIIKILCTQKRLNLLKPILTDLIESFCKISRTSVIVVCSSESDFQIIYENLININSLQSKNCIILHNFVDYRNDLIIKINDKVMNFSINSCLNKMKLQSIKLINSTLI